MAGLYLHIPFCKQACHYCDFHFSTNQDLVKNLVQALTIELQLQKNYLNSDPISSIYFGGGTPSLLSAADLNLLLNQIHKDFVIAGHPEVTLEANPDDLTEKKLAELRQCGINRLSIGIQSFDDTILKFMNRVHNAKEAHQSILAARALGFDNISIDLMYAIPGQSLLTWQKNIEHALALSPEHISAYALTIEKKTAFGQWQAKGSFTPVDEALAAEEFETLMDILDRSGYEHYEISNFCRPGFHSRHNSSYWQQKKYLGVGPSAHSFDGDSRQFNISNNPQYIAALSNGTIPFEREILSRANKINEYIFTTLRTSWGTDLEFLNQQYQYDLREENKSYFNDLHERKLVSLESTTLRLTRSGKLLADQIAADLFVDTQSDS